MKLICEQTEDIQYLKEEKEDGTKQYFIEGIFMQGDIKNKNGRYYPSSVLEEEVGRYTSNFINKKRAFGELGHPDSPQINLDRVSHMIVDLHKEGTNFVGKAKIMETPMGKIVKSLMDDGATLGVSSRGMGSLKETKRGIMEVQNDFYLATAGDIVADPSAPDAFVNGIMEGREWIYDVETGSWRLLEQVDDFVKKTRRTPKSELTEEKKLELFKNFVNLFTR